MEARRQAEHPLHVGRLRRRPGYPRRRLSATPDRGATRCIDDVETCFGDRVPEGVGAGVVSRGPRCVALGDLRVDLCWYVRDVRPLLPDAMQVEPKDGVRVEHEPASFVGWQVRPED